MSGPGSLSNFASHTPHATRVPSRPAIPPGKEEAPYMMGAIRGPKSPNHDEFGRLLKPTGDGFLGGQDIAWADPSLAAKMGVAFPPHASPYREHNNRAMRSRGLHSNAKSLITYGVSERDLSPTRGSPPKSPPQSTAFNLMLSTNEMTMPGDLLLRKSGLPIKQRMAALVRQRSLDMASLITDALKRNAHSKFGPQRGHALIDIPTFRRCLCYAFGEQWTNLAMTTPEFVESYSPYIAREQSENGDALVNWKAFSTDLSKHAGVRTSNLGYLQAEADLNERVSLARQDDGLSEEQKAELQKVVDAEYSHDIETEEEKQQEVLKDVERVTGARSVAVTRYGSYESKLHGRNQAGAIKQGDFERIGGHGDYREEQGISADGTHIKTMNTQIAGQSHEYAADGTTIVDDGSADYQVTQLKYNHKAAASASQYTADKMKSIGKTGALSNTDAVAASRAAMAAKEAEKQAKLGQQYQQMMKARGPDRFVR